MNDEYTKVLLISFTRSCQIATLRVNFRANFVLTKKLQQVKYTNIKRGHHESGGANDADRAGSGQGDDRESPAMSEVPKIYKKVAIKLTKLGSDEFDFDRYNR